MARTRLEISIAYKDKSGTTRYKNNIGNVWIDLETMKGMIDLPPGVALVSVEGQDGAYINIGLPFEKGDRQQGSGGGQRKRTNTPAAYSQDDDDSIPF